MSGLSRKLLSGAGNAGGSFIVSAGTGFTQNGLCVYDHRSPGTISILDNDAARSYSTAAFRPDGKYIAAGTGAGETPSLYIFDFTSFASLSVADTIDFSGPVARPDRIARTVRWSPNGNYLAITFNRETDSGFSEIFLVNCSDPASVSVSASIDGDGGYDLAFTPNGDYLAATTDAGLSLIDLTTAGSMTVADSYSLGTFNYAVAMNFNGTRIAVGRASSTVYLFDHSTPGTLSLLSTFTGNLDSVRGLAFTPNGKQLMCVGQSSSEYTRELLNVADDGTMTREQRYSTPGTSLAYKVDFSPDGLQVVFADAGGIKLCDFTPPSSVVQTDSESTPQAFDASFSLV